MRRGVPFFFLPAFLVMSATLPAAAQVVQDEQLWINTTVFGGVGNFAYFAEVQPRIGDGISELDQLLLRPAVGWKFNDALKIYQGYAYVRTALASGGFSEEDRSFQEINWTIGTFAGVKLSSRTRFEQRSLSTGRDIGLRFREFLRASLPLTEKKDGIAAVTWTEAFVSLNDTDWGARAGLDRVRVFAGLGLPIVGQSTFEIGYMNQTVNAPGRVEMDHILSLSLFLRH